MTDNISYRTAIIAAACHSAWYAYTVLALGEEGQPWERAPAWQKESIISAVKFWDKFALNLVGQDTSPEAHALLREKLPEASHENWVNYKVNLGWVHGPVKDPERKEHPCLAPYDTLPEEQRTKDQVVVEAYLALRQYMVTEPVGEA